MEKVKIIEVVTLVGRLCCCAIVLGFVLPFVKVVWWDEELIKLSIFQFFTNSDAVELISEYDCGDNIVTTLIIFGVIIIVSLISINKFKTSLSSIPPIVMIVCGAVGLYLLGELNDTVSQLFEYVSVKKLIGSTLLTWSFRVLIGDGIAALIVNFNLNYMSSSDSKLSKTLKSNGSASQTIKCSSCGRENNANDHFCSGCGASLTSNTNNNTYIVQKRWVCSRCGTENSANSRICDKCGNSRG